MKILVASQNAGVVGGIETYLGAAMRALVGRGHAIAHLHEQPAGGESTVAPPGAVDILGDFDSGFGRCHDWRPDVVFQNELSDPRLGEALARAYPSVALVHAYTATCVSGTKRYARPQVEPCTRTLGLRCLACYFPRRCGGSNPLTMARLYVEASRRLALLGRQDLVLVTSHAMLAEQTRHGIAPDRLRLVPFGAGSPRPSFVARAPKGRLLFMGRLTPLKGGVELVHAVALASKELGRRIEVVVAGDGPERARIEESARELRVGVRFEGWVSDERRDALLDEVDAVAVPSLWPEPFGLVGVE
ncbi:MAG TPA: glycosyltransferase family 4 protein, partial [Planctomycetota bacterium]|nr:glycosyltransferase family 4 protein [Planctomycetota bacterium]